MANNLIRESTEPCSYLSIELSEHCKNAPELYLRAMLNACAASVAVMDETGTILYVNSAWRQLAVKQALAHDLYGVGLNYLEICGQVSGASPADSAAITEGITQILLGRELEFEKQYSRHHSMSRRCGQIHAARFDLPGAFRVLISHDFVSSSERAGEEQESTEEYQSRQTEESLIHLSGRLINAQEEERKRIARELHDDLNQSMALLSIELAQLGQRIQKPRGLRSVVQSLQTQAQEISAEIHRLSYRLHPSKLDHLGLAAAVEGLCEEHFRNHELRIVFHQKGFPASIPNDVSLCVFRVAQESLRNCLKHSGARKAQVVLEKVDGTVRLSVSDDGCGFDTKSEAMKQGLGFTSMKERLHLVGGEMQVHSLPLRGTRIEISVPLIEAG
jgi:signal transduction histidine kinase